MADDRTYIKLHDGMPGHPKIRGLSDRAFRTLVRAWCYCSEYLTDGHVVPGAARDLGAPRAWQELVVVDLAEPMDDGGYWMHDYLEHQRSAQQIAELKERRRQAGRKGGRVSSKGVSTRQANGKQVLEQVLEPVRSQNDNGADNSTLNDAVDDGPPEGQKPRDSGVSRKQTAKQVLKQNESKNNPETESLTNVRDQAETDSSLRSENTRKRATRAPDEFDITDDLRKWASDRGIVADLDRETERFLDHHRAKGSTFTNWQAAWRTWMNRAEQYANVRPLSSSNGRSSGQHTFADGTPMPWDR